MEYKNVIHRVSTSSYVQNADLCRVSSGIIEYGNWQLDNRFVFHTTRSCGIQQEN